MDTTEVIPFSPQPSSSTESQPKNCVTSTPFLPRKDSTATLNFDESMIAPVGSNGGTLNCTVIENRPVKPKTSGPRKPAVIYSSDEEEEKDESSLFSSSSGDDSATFQTMGNPGSIGVIKGTPSTNSDVDVQLLTAQLDKTVPLRGSTSNKPPSTLATVPASSSSSRSSDSSSSGSSCNSSENFMRRPDKMSGRESKVAAASSVEQQSHQYRNPTTESVKKYEFKNKALTPVSTKQQPARYFDQGGARGLDDDDDDSVQVLCQQVGDISIQTEPPPRQRQTEELDKQQRRRSRSSSPEVIEQYEPRRVIPPNVHRKAPPPIIPAQPLKVKEQRQMILLPDAPSHVPDLPYELRASVGQGIQYLMKTISEIPDQDEPDELGVPEQLTVSLYDHQRYGLTWLWWREQQFPYGGILADEMGLGKTVMILSLICRGKSEATKENKAAPGWTTAEKGRLVPSRTTLVVCPPSVMGQWEDEILKKARNLRILVYHGPNRPRSAAIIAQNDIVLTSYNTLGSDVPKLTEQSAEACRSPLVRIFWERVVLDEGHIIRNPKTGGAQAACRLNARHRWVVTGTPVHNSPADMFSLAKFLQVKPFNDKQVWEMWIGMKAVKQQNAERLNIIGRALLLRRTKNEVMCGLTKAGQAIPEKQVVSIHVALKKEEREIYEHLENFAKKEFRDFMKNQEQRKDELQAAANQFMAGRKKITTVQEKTFSHLFVLILRLRQCSVLPYLIRTMIDEDDEDIDEEYDPVEDLISLKNPVFDPRFKSSKLERLYKDLLALRRKCQEQGVRMEKAVVVSQWSSLLKVVESHLKELNFSCVTISGDVKIADRMDIMSKFNGNPKRPEIMLLSLQAGGVGLNLTGANHLFFLDIHWNPQLELQAQDRIHRFGQKKPVTIYKYISGDTIEERVMELQNLKLELADGILNSAGKKDGGGLSLPQMRKLFGI